MSLSGSTLSSGCLTALDASQCVDVVLVLKSTSDFGCISPPQHQVTMLHVARAQKFYGTSG